MTTRFDSVSAMRHLTSALGVQQEKDKRAEDTGDTPHTTHFCNDDNIKDAISTLTEEFESLGIDSPRWWSSNEALAYPRSLLASPLQKWFVDLINASWSLVRKHRNLMKIHQHLEDSHRKLSNDNTNLTNHVKRLKENVKKKDDRLCELEERERRLKVQSDKLSRQLKGEKEETTKLRKQLQSKDVQHTHELRRIQQTGQKLRQQLEKSAGTCAPKNNKSPSSSSSSQQTETEKKLRIYEQTIQRLEDNNGLMLEEINELRASLALHAGAIELQVEASGLWDTTE